MELLIGRDAATSRLSIIIDGKKKVVYGEPNSVPQSVSREHCKIAIADNTYRISNIKTNNTTYVNNTSVEQKGFNPQADHIALGKDRYELNIAAILKGVQPPPTQRVRYNSLRKDLERLSRHQTKVYYQTTKNKCYTL